MSPILPSHQTLREKRLCSTSFELYSFVDEIPLSLFSQDVSMEVDSMVAQRQQKATRTPSPTSLQIRPGSKRAYTGELAASAQSPLSPSTPSLTSNTLHYLITQVFQVMITVRHVGVVALHKRKESIMFTLGKLQKPING